MVQKYLMEILQFFAIEKKKFRKSNDRQLLFENRIQ
jgi:hypothetical protein